MRRIRLPLLVLALCLPAADALAAPRMSLEGRSGITEGGEVYVARGQRVELRGRVGEFVPLQYAIVEVRRSGRRVTRQRRLIRRARQGGAFSFGFTARRTGRYLVSAEHEATPEQGRFAARTVSVRAVAWEAGSGASGVRVRVLQRGLARLSYVTSRGGSYDAATARAVLAFRKVNRMSRIGYASRRVFEMLLRGEGGYRLRHPDHGKHIEADLSRQVLVLARDGRPERIYHTSSGAGGTPTIRGSFRFYLKTPGTNAKGMVHSAYFIRGYAIHGFSSVPIFPASHGCLRVPIPNALSIFRWIRIGDRIDVYA